MYLRPGKNTGITTIIMGIKKSIKYYFNSSGNPAVWSENMDTKKIKQEKVFSNKMENLLANQS